MKLKWIPVFIATFFEILWVIGLNHAYSFWSWVGTFISILISTYLMIRAGRKGLKLVS